MRPSRGIAGFVRRRIFAKYILATILIGTILNMIVLVFYYEIRRGQETGLVAAEVATIASRVGPPAAARLREGDAEAARELLSVFAAFPYAICADLVSSPGAAAAASWPRPGCDRIRRPGVDVEVPLAAAGPDTQLRVRIDDSVIAAELRTQFLVLSGLGAIGGLALVLAGGGAFLWLIVRPVGHLIGAMEHFERHAEPRRVSYDASDEIGRVMRSYNAMLDREVERVTQIREAHQSILDSVAYATRIQRGLLPTDEQLERAFSEAAVLWRPKELVGGDLYWVHVSGPVTTLAVLDCTGHGVPGGFMTMLAVATLERIFAEEEDPKPAEVLTRLSDLTRRLLNQDAETAKSNDGMDAAVCRIDSAAGVATFAGARLSLLRLSDGRIDRHRGDRLSLGYPDTPPGPRFREEHFSVDARTRLFVTTDGIIDQLGGANRLSFGYRRLRGALLARQGESLQRTLLEVEQAIDAYRSEVPQLDDITLVAFSPRSGTQTVSVPEKSTQA